MFRIKTLNKDKAKEELETLQSQFDLGHLDDFIKNNLNDDYILLRSDLLQLFSKYKTIKDYEFDLMFGIELYKYFNSQKWFNETVASNYRFWSYVSIKVAPEIIYHRHKFKEEYYYKKNVRIYLSVLWWFIHLSFQGNTENTYECLKRYNTDYILQLVERPGKDGSYLDVYRNIMMFMNKLPLSIINKNIDNKNLFRRVLILNTARIDTYNLIFEGKCEDYVKELFELCGVEL